MKLSDIMSHAGLAIYPTIALVIFLAVFVGVSIRVLARRTHERDRVASLLPLTDDAALSPGDH
jgi:hypothetical protein